MSVIRGFLSFVARVLLCAIFFMSAVMSKILHFNEVVGMMESAGVPEPRILLPGAILFLIVGSLFVIFGFQARIGALLLLVFLVLATYYFHPFWKMPNPTPEQIAAADSEKEKEKVKQEAQEFQMQMINAMKNTSMAGAMLLIIANGAGAWSLDNRGRRDPWA
jgi:putative oxidoreductase